MRASPLNRQPQEEFMAAHITEGTCIDIRHFCTHAHGRRGPMKKFVLPEYAKRVCGAALEPNTKPHLLTYDDVRRYIEEAHEIAPGRAWLGSVYLTPEPNLKDVERLFRDGLITHIKQYPPHGSTNTDESPPMEMLLNVNSGPGKLMKLAEELGLPLKRHAELAHDGHHHVDAYHRERRDLAEIEPRMMDTYPKLRRILAHLSTAEGAAHMRQYGDPDRYVCEITPHHASAERSIVFDGGAILPDHHCLPVVKSQKHLDALRELIKDGLPYVMAGSDAAAHSTKNKYRFDAFGGFYVYHCSVEMYLQVLDELGVLNSYGDAFLYGNAKRFFGDIVPNDPKRVTFVRKPWTVESRVAVPDLDDEVTPFGYHPDKEKRHQFTWQLAA